MNTGPIAITGIGAVCSLGLDVDGILHKLRAGERGIGPLRHLDLEFPRSVFGEVALTNGELAERTGADPNSSRTLMLALMAANEATRNAGIDNAADLAVISASTVGGMDRTERAFASWMGAQQLIDVDAATGHAVGHHAEAIARTISNTGITATISTACSSSANAIIFGAQLLRAGKAKRVLAGGSDALCRFTIEGFRSLGALDPNPCRPFTEERAGLNLGEGAAYLILEPLDAMAVGRKPLALLSGWANRNDAHHQTATSPDGRGPFEAMQAALQRAGIKPDAIDHINAHGTGTGNNDDTELAAMERLFAQVPSFCSTKALTGHTLGAAGALEAVFTVLAIQYGFVPAGTPGSLPMTGHRSVPQQKPESRQVRAALSNSFGFGGNDSTLVLTSAH